MLLEFRLFRQLLLLNFLLTFLKGFGNFIFAVELQSYTCTYYIRQHFFFKFCSLLRYHYRSRCDQLVDLIGVDNLQSFRYLTRFKLVYVFASVVYNTRLACVQYTPDLVPVVSLSSLYLSANWQEREVWDLLGVVFVGHFDLRRILTDYGFFGHPLRKDFPLSGFTEVIFSDVSQLVTYQSVSLAQEFRDFGHVRNPWL